jgi:starch-binding outer membrane protein, SusD/RagB family
MTSINRDIDKHFADQKYGEEVLLRTFYGRVKVTFLFFILFFVSCTKLVEVDPPYTSFSGKNVYENDASATSAITSIYAEMSAAQIQSNSFTSLSLVAGLSADEFALYSEANVDLLRHYQNALSNQDPGVAYWFFGYGMIYRVNDAIAGLQAAKGLNHQVRDQLLGEAKFLRAFFYFYLVNLYGEVPLIVITDYAENASKNRVAINEVYKQMIADLEDAEALLSDVYPDRLLTGPTSERIRPTKWAALSLLARVYIYTKNFQLAADKATEVIDYTSLFQLETRDQVFKKNNREAIWQLQPVNLGWNSEDGRGFVIPVTGPSFSNPVFPSNSLLETFEVGDKRKDDWIGTRTIGTDTYIYANKYQCAVFNEPVSEYSTILRLAEQYLVRAEALVELGLIDNGIVDLNAIRVRAGLQPYQGAMDKESLLSAILHERRVELFSEWAHRWFDLKRTGKVDDVMSIMAPLKGGSWKTEYQLYPISVDELSKSPGMEQTRGY